MDVYDAEAQDLLAKILIDYSYYKLFKDRSLWEQLAANFSCPSDILDFVNSIDEVELDRFREVIIGSRAERLKFIFPLLYRYINNEEKWEKLIEVFHQKVVIKSGRDDTDIKLFLDFMTGEYPKSFELDICLYDYTIYIISLEMTEVSVANNDYVTLNKKTPRLSNTSRLIKFFFSLEDIKNLNKVAPINPLGYYYLFHLTLSHSIQIIELDRTFGELVNNFDGKKSWKSLSKSLPMKDKILIEDNIKQLTDMAVIKWT